MKTKSMFRSLLILGLGLILGALLIGMAGAVGAQAPGGGAALQGDLGTAFTYQGRLTDGGSVANGTYDFQFELYDAGGNQVGSTLSRNDVAVTNGLFSLPLDFGDAFTGDARFLQVSVRLGSSTGDYTMLTPRQALTATPYALALPDVFPLNGKVGIGTTSPAYKLDVVGNRIRLRNSTAAGAKTLDLRADGNAVDVSATNADLFLLSNTGDVIVQPDSGQVGIGTTSPAYKLDVVGNRIRLRNSTAAGAKTLDLRVDGGAIDVNATNADLFVYSDTGDVIMQPLGRRVGIGTTSPGFRLDVAGSAHASSFPTSSDARFKQDVERLTDVLEKLESVRGVSFEWNDVYESLGRATGHTEIGVLAQEVQAVFPELVTSWGDEGYLAVDYGRLTAVLIEAIKELRADQDAEFAALQQRNADLEARVEALEGLVAELARTE